MTTFNVTVPSSSRYTGEFAGVAFAHGEAIVSDDTSEGRRALAYLRRRNYLVEAIQPEAAAPDPVDDQPKALARNASKADWKAYAIGQGMPDADAEAATRDELAEKFLGPKEA